MARKPPVNGPKIRLTNHQHVHWTLSSLVCSLCLYSQSRPAVSLCEQCRVLNALVYEEVLCRCLHTLQTLHSNFVFQEKDLLLLLLAFLGQLYKYQNQNNYINCIDRQCESRCSIKSQTVFGQCDKQKYKSKMPV